MSEAYRDADAANAHTARTASIVARLLDGPATLESMEVHGPAAQLKSCESMPEGTRYFESTPQGYSFFSKQTGGLQCAQVTAAKKKLSDLFSPALILSSNLTLHGMNMLYWRRRCALSSRRIA